MIRKTSETRPLSATVVNEYNDSQVNAYSCGYVNNLNTYSTTEQRVGTWIDGKPIYRKVIDFGNLPNNTTKTVNHNITNIDKIWISDGFAFNTSNFTNQLSLCVPTGISDGWYFGVNSTVVQCQTGSNRSAYYAYVIVEYTKTTD